MSLAFYFGVWPGDDGGHFVFPPSGEPSWLDAHKAKAREHGCPFGAEDLDGTFTPPRRAGQGVVRFVHTTAGGKAWSVLAWHDYTGDSRPGSNSAIAIEGTHEYDAAMEIARRMFPDVFARLDRAEVEVRRWNG